MYKEQNTEQGDAQTDKTHHTNFAKNNDMKRNGTGDAHSAKRRAH